MSELCVLGNHDFAVFNEVNTVISCVTGRPCQQHQEVIQQKNRCLPQTQLAL